VGLDEKTSGFANDPNAKKVLELLGTPARHDPHSKFMVLFSNLIDMNYNFTDDAAYHLAHHIEDDGPLLKDFELATTNARNAVPPKPEPKHGKIGKFEGNCPGFVACHMFVEYLTRTKGWSYTQALEKIANDYATDEFTKMDRYIGTSYAHSTWRIYKVCEHKAEYKGDFAKTFTDIFNEDGETLKKDAVQLRVCAFILHTYLKHPTDADTFFFPTPEGIVPAPKDKRPPGSEDYVTGTNYTPEDFPPFMVEFEKRMDTFYGKTKVVLGGGRSAPRGRRRAASSPAYVTSTETAKVSGKKMRVYVGKRGGKYVRMGGEYVPLSKCRDVPRKARRGE